MKPPRITTYTAELFPANADQDDIMTRLLVHLDAAGQFVAGHGWLKAQPRSFTAPLNVEHSLLESELGIDGELYEKESFHLRGSYYFDDCVMSEPGREYTISHSISLPVRFSEEPLIYKRAIGKELFRYAPETFQTYGDNDGFGSLAFVADEDDIDEIPQAAIDEVCDAIFEVDDEPLYREFRTIYTVREPTWQLDAAQTYCYYSDIGIEVPTALYDSEERSATQQYVHGQGIDAHANDVVSVTEGMRFQPEREKATDWNYLSDDPLFRAITQEVATRGIAGVPYFQIARNIAHLSFRALPGFADTIMRQHRK